MTRKRYPAWLRRKVRGAADEATTENLAVALTRRDRDALRALLAVDVVVVIDSGGIAFAAREPVHGQAAASAALLDLVTTETTAAMASVNGVPGFTLIHAAEVFAVVTAEARSRHVSSIWVVCNPDKLRPWNR